jgi:hypothetical protein
MENTHNHDLEVITFPIDFIDFNLQQVVMNSPLKLKHLVINSQLINIVLKLRLTFHFNLMKIFVLMMMMIDNDNDDEEVPWEWKEQSPNAYQYQFGNVYEAKWCIKFLYASMRERTYYLSSYDCYGEFRSLFCMSLVKIDDLVSLYVENGWVQQTKHCKSEEEMMTRLGLHVMGVLKVLGHNS